MRLFLLNFLIVLVALVIGSLVNGALIAVSGKVIPPPNGADVTTLEGLRASIHLFEPKHFLFPFLAHALGTLVGAFLAAKFARSHKFLCAMIIGCIFLVGGSINVALLPAPMWFNVTDLVLAYLPMAWLGHRLGAGKSG